MIKKNVVDPEIWLCVFECGYVYEPPVYIVLVSVLCVCVCVWLYEVLVVCEWV